MSRLLQLDKQRVGNQFGKAADTYDEVADLQRTVADRLMDSLLSQTNDQAMTLVDIGCGTGYALQKLARLRPEWRRFGLDLSADMLETAQKQVDQTAFLQADMEALPFADNSVDVIFSSSSLQWCDPSLVWSEIARVLKPQGKAFVSSFLQGTLSDWRQWWMTSAEREKQPMLSENEFMAALTPDPGIERSPELTLLSHHRETIEQRFHSFSDALNSVRCVGAGNAARSRKTGLMGKNQYRAIRTAIEKALHDDEAIEMPYEVIYCVVSKALG